MNHKHLFSHLIRCQLPLKPLGLVIFAACILPATISQCGEPVPGFKPTSQNRFFDPEPVFKSIWNEGEFTEGPAVAPDNSVNFSDIGNRMMKYDPKTGKVTVFRDPSHRSNGIFFDRRGNMFVCEGANTGGGRRITVTRPDGSQQVLADRYNGKRLNSPNDLFVCDSGNLYFTDPRYVGDEPVELPFHGVFRISKQGKITLATDRLTRPNGILIGPEEKKAYVAEHHPTGAKQLLAFDIQPETGRFSNRKILFDFGEQRGIDGMCFGPEGNIFATAGDNQYSGIYVFSTTGKNLAFIATPGAPTNCTFGTGKFSKRLYVTSANPDGKKYGLYYVDLR